ncbi:MAG: DNA polymerase III subunit chi [Qipengyuania sp.]
MASSSEAIGRKKRTRVDFYQLSRDPVEQVVPLLARKVLEAGERLLVFCEEARARAALSDALWDRGGVGFLANGEAGEPYAARQPILLAAGCDAHNDAKMALIADGQWRDGASAFERVLLLFVAQETEAARQLWRDLGATRNFDLHIFKQREDGGWREGA